MHPRAVGALNLRKREQKVSFHKSSNIVRIHQPQSSGYIILDFWITTTKFCQIRIVQNNVLKMNGL